MGKNIRSILAKSACESGLCFALETLITGSIWAHEAWGSAWVWEPRLTGMLLTTLFFLSWRLVIAILGVEAISNRKMTASLIVMGLPSMAFTHMAARLFGGIHPKDMSHLADSDRLLLPFFVLGGIQILLGVGWIALRARRQQTGGCMGSPTASP